MVSYELHGTRWNLKAKLEEEIASHDIRVAVCIFAIMAASRGTVVGALLLRYGNKFAGSHFVTTTVGRQVKPQWLQCNIHSLIS